MPAEFHRYLTCFPLDV